jgi:very-short-patch-repair endonuclease
MRTSTRTVVARAKALRRAMTLPDILLWDVLRGRGAGPRFRHQHSAGPYVLDFYCPESALCIEVDGKAHDMGANPQRDGTRDAWLGLRGIKTVRIPAAEILRDLEPVIILIQQECDARKPRQSSPAFAGEGDRAKCGGGASFAPQPQEAPLPASPVPLPSKTRGGSWETR